MVEGAVVKLAVPVVLIDVFGVKLVPEAEDAIRMGFGGIKVVLRALEGSELFDGKIFGEAFDREVGDIVGNSIESWGFI